jgi:hypothetical protein
MKTSIIVTIIFFASNCTTQDKFPVLKGPYLGQKPPGMTPEIFAPGIVSTGMNESSLVFSPDHSELYYDMTHHTHRFTAIVCMRRHGGVWQKHEVAPFSGKFMDSSPFISWNNQRLFYCSNRPFQENHDVQDFDLWYVERRDDGWDDPMNLGPQINSDQVDVNPCVTEKGVLYFASNRDGGRGGHDIYKSLLIDGKYQTAVNLGEPINTSDFESSPYVSSDESYIIFNVFIGRNSNRKSGLHISFKKQDGTWNNPVYMGDTINRDKPGMFAYVSPDGRYLFFTSQYVPYLPYTGEAVNYTQLKEMLNSPQNGSGDICWVDAKIIEELKPDKLK